MLSFITTCKNRLAHLKQTLPLMASQSGSEVIVVDYGCEQGTAEWVEKTFPKVKVIRVVDDPRFLASRARNIGARQATGEFLCFIDADVLLKIDIGAWAGEFAQPHMFYVSGNPRDFGTWGFVICSRASFERIDGYDEAYDGWGGEDVDLYDRLRALDYSRATVPSDALAAIKHGDELRQVGKKDPDFFNSTEEAVAMHESYRLIKFDIAKLVGSVPDLTLRKRIYAGIRSAHSKALATGETHFTFTVHVPYDRLANLKSRTERKLQYRIPVVPSRLAERAKLPS